MLNSVNILSSPPIQKPLFCLKQKQRDKRAQIDFLRTLWYNATQLNGYMMEQKANFSDADIKTIADALNDLKEVCLPLPHEITTTTQIHAPTSAVSLSPDRYDTIQDLRTMAYLGMLPDNIHMIKTGDTCWFYSELNPSDFYSDKTNIYVVFGTQQPSDPAILKNKQIIGLTEDRK